MILYHATPEKNLPAIQAEGLVPRIGPRSRCIGEETPAIYFFDSLDLLDDALGGWLGDAFEEEGVSNVSVLSVTLDEDLCARLVNDGFSQSLAAPVPPGAVHLLWTEIDFDAA